MINGVSANPSAEAVRFNCNFFKYESMKLKRTQNPISTRKEIIKNTGEKEIQIFMPRIVTENTTYGKRSVNKGKVLVLNTKLRSATQKRETIHQKKQECL